MKSFVTTTVTVDWEAVWADMNARYPDAVLDGLRTEMLGKILAHKGPSLSVAQRIDLVRQPHRRLNKTQVIVEATERLLNANGCVSLQDVRAEVQRTHGFPVLSTEWSNARKSGHIQNAVTERRKVNNVTFVYLRREA